VAVHGSPIASPAVMLFFGRSFTGLERSIWRLLWHLGRTSLHVWLTGADANERHRTVS
jgi:hypothetical protein